jgi:hypothetical protein
MAKENKYIKSFNNEDSLKMTVESLISAGILNFEVFSPYPVDFTHEKKSKKWNIISLYALAGGIIGLVLSYFFLFWIMGFDYKLNLGGKPFFSIIYSVPLIFVFSIFVSAIFVFIGFLKESKLPKWYHEYQDNQDFLDAVDDKFVLVISDEKDLEKIESLKV